MKIYASMDKWINQVKWINKIRNKKKKSNYFSTITLRKTTSTINFIYIF